MATIGDAEDAFGRSLVDHLEGRPGPALMLEADDGSIRTADLQPRDFFLEHDAWSALERAVIARATGAVLDLGAGAGRHAVHLQRAGHAVTAVDASPGAAAVCRARGIADVRLADLNDPGLAGLEGRWDTILLLCGNLGLGGDWDPSRDLLRRLAGRTPPGGLLIGDSVDPASDDPDDLAYEERNRASGFHRGHVTLRLHYGTIATPWWPQMNIPPDDLEALVSGTGWTAAQMDDADGYAVVLRRS